MLVLLAQTGPNIDYSNIHEWQTFTFIGVGIVLILAVIVPTIIACVGMMLRANTAAHREQMTAMSETYQTQNKALMEHQKEQIVRIYDSHAKNNDRNAETFDKSLATFERSLEKRDKEQAAIMGELRVINDKVDDVKTRLITHVQDHHHATNNQEES